MKFNFESENVDGAICTQSFEACTWTEALDYFVKFLRGSGYSLEDNSVAVNTDLHMMDDYNLCSIGRYSDNADYPELFKFPEDD